MHQLFLASEACNILARLADMIYVLVQLDAAWKAALGGVSVVIASGKAKDGVLQVTAGVTSNTSFTSTMPVCPFLAIYLSV